MGTHFVPEVGQRVERGWPYHFLQRGLVGNTLRPKAQPAGGAEGGGDAEEERQDKTKI